MFGPLLMGLGSSLASSSTGKKAAKAIGIGGSSGGGGVRKRRRPRLTQSAKDELMFLKMTIGKTAAANAVPFYLGRRS